MVRRVNSPRGAVVVLADGPGFEELLLGPGRNHDLAGRLNEPSLVVVRFLRRGGWLALALLRACRSEGELGAALGVS